MLFNFTRENNGRKKNRKNSNTKILHKTSPIDKPSSWIIYKKLIINRKKAAPYEAANCYKK